MLDELIKEGKAHSFALDIGKAGEHLVCFDLITQGYTAYLSDQGLNYDIVLDYKGKLYRIQVKSTIRAKNVNSQGRNERIAYSWSVRRRGYKGTDRLSNEQCDIVALVALDIKTIAYFPVNLVGETIQLSPPDKPSETHTSKDGWGKPVSEYPISNILKENLEHYTKTTSMTHCKWGHKYSEENTGTATNGSRYCKECSRKKSREYQRKRRRDRRTTEEVC